MAYCHSMCLTHLSPRVLSSSSSTDLSSLSFSVVNISSHISHHQQSSPPPPSPSPSSNLFWSFGFLSSMVSFSRITSLIYNDGSSYRREAGVEGGGGGESFSFGFLNQTDDSKELEEGVFYALCASYALIAFIALVQLFRIQMRVPEYGWTTQKVFHLMNFIVNGLRAILFGLYKSVFLLRPKVLEMALLDLPSLLFFSTYTLLVLFWAEIYHQAKSLPITKLRPAYLSINGVVYIIQVCIWISIKLSRDHVAVEVAKLFLSVISFFAALGFLIYGGRLFYLLRRFPIESKGRRNKLNEVGFVTGICCTCFLIRCIVVAVSAFDKDVDLDVLNHPILNLMYYMLVEIVPSALVLFILRKLPPKRVSEQYHPIR